MAAKISRWLFFSVMFSLIPLLASYLTASSDKKDWPQLSSALGSGELFLLSTTFAAVGLGELLGGNQRYPVAKIIVGGFSFLKLCMSTFLYAAANHSAAGTAETFYLNTSYWIFIFSCVVSTSCIALSEIKDA